MRCGAGKSLNAFPLAVGVTRRILQERQFFSVPLRVIMFMVMFWLLMGAG